MKNKDFTNNDVKLERLSSLQNNLNYTTETVKQQCLAKIAKKLSELDINTKTYWSILKSFLTGKKFLCIPPVFHENRFITDFRENAELFNSFFAGLFIYLIHCLNSITRSYKTNLHRASIKTLHIKLTEYHIIGLCREPIFQS